MSIFANVVRMISHYSHYFVDILESIFKANPNINRLTFSLKLIIKPEFVKYLTPKKRRHRINKITQ